MSFFSKLFGKKETPAPAETKMPWIAPGNNRWGIRLLDMRPVLEGMILTSKDEQQARNSLSYTGDSGLSFAGLAPETSDQYFETDIRFATAGILPYGVLFTPRQMEHKWAIFFHQDEIIFVRSWQRLVHATAQVVREPGSIRIKSIKGCLTGEDNAADAAAVLRFIIQSHVMGENVPCPLPPELADTPHDAALWAFSAYGNFAKLGAFEAYEHESKQPLRSISLLHIATAMGDEEAIREQIAAGTSLQYMATDGNTPLHWCQDIPTIQLLLELGANINEGSDEGATLLMNAVQREDAERVQFLIEAGADLNVADHRGFTALHRAAEMGLAGIVGMLLSHGADKSMTAQGYTALALAEIRKQDAIVAMLK